MYCLPEPRRCLVIGLYRYERQLKFVEKAERMAQEAGFTPQAVSPRFCFPWMSRQILSSQKLWPM